MNARPHLSSTPQAAASLGLTTAAASGPGTAAFLLGAEDKPAPASFRASDEAIFRKLVQDHRHRLYRFVVKHIGWSSDAEDITQQAFVEAAHSFATFKGESELSTWLYQGRPDGWVEVLAEVRGASLFLTLRDRAPAFDPRRGPTPDRSSPLEERPVGGLGLMFVQRLSDAFDYRRIPESAGGGINEVRITRHLAQPAS